MAFLINVASSIVTNIALVGPWFERPRLRDRGIFGGISSIDGPKTNSKVVLGEGHLVFFSSSSLKTREKYS